MWSFIIAFVLVLAYMLFFYSKSAGLAADVALLANLFFLFGILASIGAVLTLPGIAGIVLTMGMAVNANLAGAAIALDTRNPEQLTLNQPDLIDETLAPGESCTLTFVLQVPQDYIGELNATGTLTVTLPYAQDTVEPAPAAAHTHA